jgi:NhaP-type Na+/H+ or K+/H+ antiporter/K+/H+ antiporter YhaU regulatory subunit KhtT
VLESYLLNLKQSDPVIAMMAALVCVLIIGTSAQIFAERLRIPATGPLLISGVLFGPEILGLVQPAILDDFMRVIVKMAVAIVIFEGGMLLNIYDLRHASRAVTGLTTVGLLITTALAAVLAHFILGLSWEISLLFGSIVSVTGPTVITPILQKVTVNRRVRSTLESESIIADPLGVILAAIIFTAILNTEGWGYVVYHAVETVLSGLLTGVSIAFIVYLIAERFRLLPAKYTRLIILGCALAAYTIAEFFAHESGVLAAAIAGVAIGSMDIPHKELVEEFKGDLASIAVSAVFILLAASLSLQDLASLGWRGALVVFLLMIAVRPIRVFLSTFGSELRRSEKFFISFIGPRGIVAASVAAFFSLRLIERGYPNQGKTLVALVFAVILATVLIEGTFAGWLAKFFKVMPQHTVIIGADETARMLAERLVTAGETVSMIDNREENCAKAAHLKGVNIHCADATDRDVLRKADIPNAKTIIVATESDKVNLLVSQVIRSNFGDKRIVARANSTSNLSAFIEVGIETMSPVLATAAILENMVLRPSLFKLLATRSESEDEHIDEVRVTSRKSVGDNLAKLNLRGCLVVALRREGKLIPPNGATVLRYDDILTLLGDNKSLESAKRILQVAD